MPSSRAGQVPHQFRHAFNRVPLMMGQPIALIVAAAELLSLSPAEREQQLATI
jgi:hypothetical protein